MMTVTMIALQVRNYKRLSAELAKLIEMMAYVHCDACCDFVLRQSAFGILLLLT